MTTKYTYDMNFHCTSLLSTPCKQIFCRIGMVRGCLVCWRLQGRFPAEAAKIYTMHEEHRGTFHEGEGVRQVSWTAVADTIVSSWLWSTATRSSQLGYFSRLLYVLDNWPYLILLWGTPGHRRLPILYPVKHCKEFLLWLSDGSAHIAGPGEVYLHAGSRLLLTCWVNAPPRPPTLHWTHNGTLLNDTTARYSVNTPAHFSMTQPPGIV